MTLGAVQRAMSALWRGSMERGARRPGLRPRLSIAYRYGHALYRRLQRLPGALCRQSEFAVRAPFERAAQLLGARIGRGSAAEIAAASEPIDLPGIPYKVLVSLEKHHARRENAQRQLNALGLSAIWRIPVGIDDIPWSQLPREYREAPRRASQAMTLLSILEEVEQANVPAFMHLEDDVIFHPRFPALLRRIRVPRDWKFIYLGGRNRGARQAISRGLVRSRFAADLHAVIFRSDMIGHLRRVLLDPSITAVDLDYRIATLHDTYPTYLCRPNLAWQSPHPDDDGRSPAYCNYYSNGAVRVGQGD